MDKLVNPVKSIQLVSCFEWKKISSNLKVYAEIHRLIESGYEKIKEPEPLFQVAHLIKLLLQINLDVV